MALKQTAEYKRQDFVYNGSDDDSWRITIIDSESRQYVEIAKSGEEETHAWDIEMLLDIADAIRQFRRKTSPSNKNAGHLPGPNIVDHRPKSDSQTKAEIVQSSVDESMSKIDDSVRPVESMQSDINNRISNPPSSPPPDRSSVKKSGVSAKDVL